MKYESIYEVKTIKVKIRDCGVERPTMRDPEAVVKFARNIFSELDADQEHFVILTLNKANAVTGYKIICSGGMDEASVDSRIVFRNALLMGATAMILVHNHPSGRTEASQEDLALTRRLCEGAKIIGVKVLDHIILAGEKYFSFNEHALIGG